MPRDLFEESFASPGGQGVEPVAAPRDLFHETTPVPPRIRTLVGSAPPEGRLVTLQKQYPNAKIEPDQAGNFLIHDPQAGTLIYNQPGLDVGDIASLGPEAAQGVGGSIGMAVSAPTLFGSVAGAGLGAAAGKELFSLYSKSLGVEDPRTVSAMVGDMGITAFENALGQMGGMALGATAREAVKRLVRGGKAGLDAFSQAVSDADRWGVPISVGEAKGPHSIFRFLDEINPLVAGKLRGEAAVKARNMLKAMATAEGPGLSREPDVMGKAIQAAIPGYRRGQDAVGHALDQEVYRMVPGETRFDMTNTAAALPRISPVIESMPAFSQGLAADPLGRKVAQIASDIQRNGGQLPFADIRELRQQIISGISDNIVSTIPAAKLRDLYGVLSADIKAGLAKNNPAALSAFDQATNFWTEKLAERENILGPLLAQGIPEKVTAAVQGSLKDGPSVITSVMRSLNPAQRNAMRATVLDGLGYVQGEGVPVGTWSFDQFVSDWGGMNARARNILFRDRTMARDLDQLYETSIRLSKNAAPPRPAIPLYALAGGVGAATAGAAGLAAGTGGWFILPAGFAITLAGASYGQALLRNREFVHWLAQGTRIAPEGYGAHIGRLAGIAANSSPQVREGINRVLEGFTLFGPEKDQNGP